MLTPKQEKFVQNLITGMSQREAYKNSYKADKMSNRAIDIEASKLFNSPKITLRYKELIEETKNDAIITSKELQQMYTEILKGERKFKTYKVTFDGEVIESEIPTNATDWLRTADQLSKLQGVYHNNLNITDKREDTKLDKILEQLDGK